MLPTTELQAYFDNPGGGDPVNASLFDNTLLEVSRFAPPTAVDVVQKWPVLIQINKPGAVAVNVTIEWSVSTIPGEFITVLLIDHDTLPAYKVTNMGSSPTGSYSIPVGLDAGGKATRNLSVVVTRSNVQTMALPADFNIVALTVQPESTLIGDIFKFSGPDRLSLVDDPQSNVFFVNAWDPKGEVPIDQRAGTPATLFPTDRLVPGQGYMVFVVNLDNLQPPRDHMLIIPGRLLLDTTRGRS